MKLHSSALQAAKDTTILNLIPRLSRTDFFLRRAMNTQSTGYYGQALCLSNLFEKPTDRSA